MGALWVPWSRGQVFAVRHGAEGARVLSKEPGAVHSVAATSAGQHL